MLVDKKRQEKFAQALAGTLERAGLKAFRGAVMLVEVEDASSPTGVTVMGTMSGDHQVIAGMLAQQLRRMLSEPVTLVPFGGAANDAPTPADPSKGN